MSNKIITNKIFDEVDTVSECDNTIELNYRDFIKKSVKIEEGNEYIIHSKYGGMYMIKLGCGEKDELCEIWYNESEYTKFWFSNIKASEYLNLKKTYLTNKFSNSYSELDLEDECHPSLFINFTSYKDFIKDAIAILEIHNQEFHKKFNELEKEVDKTINNFKF